MMRTVSAKVSGESVLHLFTFQKWAPWQLAASLCVNPEVL